VTAMVPRVVLAGGSGFLGQSLARALVSCGYDPIVLSRSPGNGHGEARKVTWDGRTVGARADIEGGYDATGPSPCTNQVFMATLRSMLRRPWSPPTPATAVHVGAFFMRTEPSLALTGRRCVPARSAAQGVECAHTELDETLRSVGQAR
jgi:NAD dependent epimerase/dehydratase family enzyme